MSNIDGGTDFNRTADGSNDDAAMPMITELALFSQKYFHSENINVGDLRCLSSYSELAQTISSAQTTFPCKYLK